VESESGRSVISAAFDLLAQVGVLEPVRLVDLAAVSGIPRPTVHRLLAQLIEAGAVRREGTRYRLGLTLLGLGERVAPERRLRMAARLPLAELAAATGATVAMSAAVGEDIVFLDLIDAQCALRRSPELGSPVPDGTAMARVHGLGDPAVPHRPPVLAVDLGGVDPDLSCVAAAVRLPHGGRAAVTIVVPGTHLPHHLLDAVRATAARISGLLSLAPVPDPAPSPDPTLPPHSE
jgi:DNA-binding IclR family transcriptional regulator